MARRLEIVVKCQVKGCRSTDAHERSYFAKNYEGPCGDSFCYASCTLSSCKSQRAILCDKHYKELKKDGTR